MKKKIREQLRWVITCIVGLFCLWFLPSVALATSTTAYPITTEYQEITDIAGVKNNFSLSGDTTNPAYWDPNSDYAILTIDKQWQLGSIYLNNKVQLDSNFSITGKEMVYFKKGQPMADGIGIIFHTGAVNQAGNKGGDLGVGGLPNALGFVFDLYRNAGDPAVPYIGIWSTDSAGTISRDKNIATPTLQNLATGYYTFDYSFTYNSTTSPRTITFQMKYNGVNLIDGDGYVLNIPNDVYEYSFAITASTGFYNTFQAVKVDKSSIPILVTNTPTVTKEVGSTYATTLTLKDRTSTDPKIIANYPDGVPYPAGSVVTVNGTDYTVDDNSSITVPLGTTATETELTIAVKSFKEYNNQKFDGRVSDSITYTRQQRFWGNVPWSFDSDTGTITFTSGGTLGPFYESPWNRSDALRIPNTSVKKIVFTSPVSTQAEAGYLFGGFTTQTEGQQTAYSLQNLTTIEGLTYLDTSNATSMTGMFLYASSLTSLDLSKFNTSKVTSMRDMFAVASGLTSLNLSNFDTSQVIDMANMFQTTSSLTSLNLSSFKTSKVTSIYNFLNGASKLTNVDITNFDTSKVTDMSNMFSGMSSLTSLDLANFDNTTLNPNINRALADTRSLKSITFGPKFKDTSNVSALPNITANTTYSGNWQYQVDGSIVGTTSQFLANYDGTKPGTYVWSPATVTMTVNYLDAIDKKPIFEDALQTSTTKTAITKTVKIGAAISDQLSATDLAFDGYGTITSDSYTTGTSNTQEYTTVPSKDFSITYYYTPMTKLISVPDEFSFGNFDPRDLLAKETVTYPTNSPIENVKILNTNRTVQWVLSAQMSSAVQRDIDGLALKGYVFYQDTDKVKKKIITGSSTQLATQSTSTPVQQFVTVLGNSTDNVGIGMDIYDTQRNYLGNYTGKIDWLLTTKNR